MSFRITHHFVFGKYKHFAVSDIYLSHTVIIFKFQSTSESSQDDVDDQLQMLLEMFPQTLRLEVEQCFHSAERDVDRTVQLILHREETGTAITEESISKVCPL